MIFKRDNLKNKKNFYLILIIAEIAIYISLFFTNIHWLFLILIFPFLLIDLISNKRCLKRQKNFIKEIEFHKNKLTCIHLKDSTTSIDFNDLIFSFREIKFEKDKSEIEIKTKGRLRNKLIGRIHISNWENIFEIKNELLNNEIVRVKFKPEGFWSKYGGLTADIVITTSALAIGELGDLAGDTQGASNARDIAFQSNFDDLHKEHENKASS
tara:strand:- start:4380 stop:5015 length:636 start_codon:yes stop_codon:yes gene_type:complete